jgi:hypothetical protein
MSEFKNTNPYNDDEFSLGAMKIASGVRAAWEAGGSLDDIAEVVRGALEDCDVPTPEVEIFAVGENSS